MIRSRRDIMTTLIAISRGSFGGASMSPRAIRKVSPHFARFRAEYDGEKRGLKTTCLTSKALLRSPAASKRSRFFSGAKSRRFDERPPNAAGRYNPSGAGFVFLRGRAPAAPGLWPSETTEPRSASYVTDFLATSDGLFLPRHSYSSKTRICAARLFGLSRRSRRSAREPIPLGYGNFVVYRRRQRDLN
jgi:hypothetical protein